MTVPHQAAHRSGPDALRRVADEAVADGARRVLLVTGRRSYDESGAADHLDTLIRRATVERWSDISPNTDSVELDRGLSLLADFRPDTIVGIGGGSVMDMAKLLCAYDPSLTGDRLLTAIRGGAHKPRRRQRLILTPTTSGSGSEATHFAVVYIGEDKYSISGAALRADVVALVPELTLTAGPHQRATSGTDAICQAIESRWAVGATRRSRRYAEWALTILLGHVVAFVRGDNERAAAMQLGSHLAGRAIDISKTTAAHALSYGITKQLGVDHGSAVALTLGNFIEFHANASTERLQPVVDPDEHRRAIGAVTSRLGATDGATAAAAFRSLLHRIDLPASIDEVEGFQPTMATAFALSVNAERLGNNPVVLDTADLIRLTDPGTGDPSYDA